MKEIQSELARLKKGIDEAKGNVSKLEGREEELLRQLKTEYNLDSIDEAKKEVDVPVAYLGLSDRRYAVVTGSSKVLDLETGETLEGLSKQPLERIQYNLTVLFLGECAAYRRAETGVSLDGNQKSTRPSPSRSA